MIWPMMDAAGFITISARHPVTMTVIKGMITTSSDFGTIDFNSFSILLMTKTERRIGIMEP